MDRCRGTTDQEQTLQRLIDKQKLLDTVDYFCRHFRSKYFIDSGFNDSSVIIAAMKLTGLIPECEVYNFSMNSTDSVPGDACILFIPIPFSLLGIKCCET